MTLGLIIGILVCEDTAIPWITLLTALSLLIIALPYLHFKNHIKHKTLISLIMLLLMVAMGITVTKLRTPEDNKQHYVHLLDSKNQTKKKVLLQIRTVLKSTAYNQRFYAKILQLDTTRVSGKVLLNIRKDSLKKTIEVGDIVLMYSRLIPILKPKNPHDYNYKTYLKRKGIFHQIKSNTETLKIYKTSKKSVLGESFKLNKKIENKIDSLQLKPTSIAFLKAFYLGNRNEIPEDITSDYKNAGVLHILALSGLHVGILLLFFKLLLRPLLWIKKGGQIRSISIICLLWIFALITGLSPSIVRAVSMFSLFVIAEMLNRQTNSINTLFISAFIILIIKPMQCFDVGFQLSYLAVLGIIIVKPKLDRISTSKFKFIEFFNATLKVSLAAQIGILPLLLYYFHQFPGVFLLANIVVLPLLIVLLYLGALVVLLAMMGGYISMLNLSFEAVLNLMNRYVNWVASHEFLIFKNIPFDQWMLWGLYGLIFLCLRFFSNRNYKNIIFMLSAMAVFHMYCLQKLNLNPKKEFTVFHQIKKTVLGFRNSSNFQLHQVDTIKPYFLENYTSREGLLGVNFQPLEKFYSIGDKNLLLVDTLGIYKLKKTQVDWVLLTNSPKIHLEDLIEVLRPELILADGSNYTSFIERWRKTCLKYKIKFHDTASKGAFVIQAKP